VGAARHYVVDPLSGEAADVTPGAKEVVLVANATMWSEYFMGHIDNSVSGPGRVEILRSATGHRSPSPT